MQLKLKNVSNLVVSELYMLLLLGIFSINIMSSQKLDFILDNDGFRIVEDGKCIYVDSTNFKSGSCNSIDVLKSDFSNQFYLFIENTCTRNNVKQLFKVNWENKKFKIINKEYISIFKSNHQSKNIYFDDFILDSLDVNLLDVEETFNKKVSKNKTPVYFKGRILGYKVLSKENIFYNYPVLDNYQDIHDNINLYNDIAFILSKNELFTEAIFVLKKVIEISPERVVAYLNLADCYWETNQKTKAKENYEKYLKLMKEQKKDLKKIPKYVYDRMKVSQNEYKE